MIRQTMRSAALAVVGLLLANVAWGQGPVLRQASSAMQYVASEYFGGEARMVQVSNMDVDRPETDNGQQRPYVGLTLSGGPVTRGNSANITFTLHGATFDQPASPTNLDQRPNTGGAVCAGDRGNAIEASVISGGARGDSSVTYRVELTDTVDAGLPNDNAICFWVPDLSVTLATISAPGATPVVRGVNVTASAIEPVVSSGTPFPSRISGPLAGDMDANDDGDALDGAEVGSAANTDATILQATPALTASLGMGGKAYVAITDRTKIAQGGTPDPSESNPSSATMGLSVGMLSVQVSQMDIWELDGGGLLPKKQIDGSLSGQIDLTVAGRFQSGDRVVVGSGPTALAGEIEGMVAEVSVQTAMIAGMPIVYVPGGVDALKPGTFTAGAAYLFNDRRNANAAITPMSMGEIKYAGIEVEGYAYGVVRGGAMDRSFVRVTCESATDCAIFADCTGQDGTNYFEAAPPIPGGQTVAWNSDDIEGLVGDGWTAGRGRCDVLSNGELSVQHLVRSGGILVNSSSVVGRSLDLRADRARAQIDTVVDNICSSVKGHLGRTASDPDGTPGNSDDISGHMPTMCKSADAELIPNTRDTNGDPSTDNSNPNGF
ncbi:MAG: hypothetical protein F4220_02350 [Gammaproteobacteria bacterium]|nr:hypothetical protein [Gammaproteobacteria bacterium]